MKPGIHERKWEIDSLCYPMRLANGYWELTGDLSLFDTDWKQVMKLILRTFKEQQRISDKGPYRFQRKTSWAIDGVPMEGYGYPTKKVGMIHSMFRPSDDATIYPFLVPGNLFALASVRQLTLISMQLNEKELYNDCLVLLDQLFGAVKQYATVTHPQFGKIFAYETNGFGSYNLMDDANVPSLLALPYLDRNMI